MPTNLRDVALKLSDIQTCIDHYSAAFQSRWGDIFLVANITRGNGTLSQIKTLDVRYDVYRPFDWICAQRAYEDKPCDEQIAAIKRDIDSWRPFDLEIQSCYSKETQEHSKLFFSRTICWVVTVLNLSKAVLMLIIAYDGIDAAERPILTVGDAVASYLADPDEHTKGMCLQSKTAFAKKDWEPGLRQFDSTRHRKFSAGSVSRWTICILLCLLALCVCGYLLAYGISRLGFYSSSNATVDLRKYQLGVVHPDVIMRIFPTGSDYLVFSVIIANTPQILMSFIYFNYNALFTCLSLATEWDRFSSAKKKGLRVSGERQGAQRQTYFLQLPYRYSLPLAVFSGGLHWLISQSIFLVRIEMYHDGHNPVANMTSCGWSPPGIICVICAGTALIGFIVASGYRRLRFGGIPIAGSCSAAISAACHPEPSEQGSSENLPLSWGVVSRKNAASGHCSLTSKDVQKPMEDCLYQ